MIGKDKGFTKNLDEIIRQLEIKNFDVARAKAKNLESEYPNYSSYQRGYLLDYCIGQAIFRSKIENSENDMNAINEAIKYFDKSIGQNPNFDDAHLFLGFSYNMKQAIMIARRFPEKDEILNCNELALKHLDLARKYNPNYKIYVDSMIEDLIQSRSKVLN